MNAFGQRRLAATKIEAPVIPDAPEPQLRALNTGPLADLRALCLARVDATTDFKRLRFLTIGRISNLENP